MHGICPLNMRKNYLKHVKLVPFGFIFLFAFAFPTSMVQNGLQQAQNAM